MRLTGLETLNLSITVTNHVSCLITMEDYTYSYKDIITIYAPVTVSTSNYIATYMCDLKLFQDPKMKPNHTFGLLCS